MAESTGMIHGQISRREAWEAWRPYGERGDEVDGTLDPDNIQPFEAVQVLIGADNETQYKLATDYEPADKDAHWFEGVRSAVVDGSGDRGGLREILANSQIQQQAVADKLKHEAIDGGLKLTSLLSGAAHKLASEGIISKGQADQAESWLVAPDGHPYMQYRPMSQLEYGRLAVKYDHEEPDISFGDGTNFRLGVLQHAVRSNNAPNYSIDHNRVHESVHGGFAGIEIWDITRKDGDRMTQATVIGHFACQPTTEVIAGDDYGTVQNCEVAEGLTDFIARQLMRVEPRLGTAVDIDTGYGAWAEKIAEIRKAMPDLYRVIVDTAFVEADPSNPNSKRDALLELNEYADKKLGVPDSLTHVFNDAGGSLLDIYSKGKK